MSPFSRPPCLHFPDPPTKPTRKLCWPCPRFPDPPLRFPDPPLPFFRPPVQKEPSGASGLLTPYQSAHPAKQGTRRVKQVYYLLNVNGYFVPIGSFSIRPPCEAGYRACEIEFINGYLFTLCSGVWNLFAGGACGCLRFPDHPVSILPTPLQLSLIHI